VTRGHTVLAGRAAFAGAWGDRSVRRIFAAGSPGPSVAAFDFGRDTIGLLRGFQSDDVVGAQAAVVNVDLRFPLAYPQRGPGSWPIFVRSLHGALFVDAGNAWTGSFRRSDIRSSVGAELSTDIVLGHYLPLTLVGGGAWIRDPVSGRSEAAVFGRVGRAF
jgi:outer membrane protein assembly factor BamA